MTTTGSLPSTFCALCEHDPRGQVGPAKSSVIADKSLAATAHRGCSVGHLRAIHTHLVGVVGGSRYASKRSGTLSIGMARVTISRDHHVVPQFHLRRFADSERKIRQLSRGDRDGRLIAVKRATVQDAFYNIKTAAGDDHDGWEKILGTLEARAARAIASIVECGVWPLPDLERERLVNWIAAQYLRTPAFRFQVDVSLDDWRAEVDRGGPDAILRAVNRPDLPEADALALWARGDGYYPRGAYQSNNVQLRWFRDMLWDTAKAFYERRWVLVRFPQACLLTADNAVVAIDDREVLHPLAPGARLVAIALDRRHLLQLVDARPHHDLAVVGDGELAVMHNAMAMHACDRYAYQHPSDDFADGLWDLPERALEADGGESQT